MGPGKVGFQNSFYQIKVLEQVKRALIPWGGAFWSMVSGIRRFPEWDQDQA
jgi:hypothetical protein